MRTRRKDVISMATIFGVTSLELTDEQEMIDIDNENMK